MKVLVAEDEPKMAQLLRSGLVGEGYAVDLVNNGNDALRLARSRSYDVVVLDVMLPLMDGFEVCSALRADGISTPILMLTARDAVPDRIRGLDVGADDYFVKPFAFAELLARLRALTRRTAAAPGSTLQVADLVLDPTTREVRRGSRPVRLTTTEFTLLRYLLEHPGETLTREQILENVWGWSYEGSSNVVDVYVGYLRAKIGLPTEEPLIRTVRGVGYVVGTD